MRRIVAELDGEDGDGFAVIRLTDGPLCTRT